MSMGIDVVAARNNLIDRISVECAGGRGSGRTRLMVELLPRWAYVIVSNHNMGEYIANMIRECRGEEFFRTCSIYSTRNPHVLETIRMTDRPVCVDHSVWESTHNPYDSELFRVLVDREVRRLDSVRRELDSQARGWVAANSTRWLFVDESANVVLSRSSRAARPEVFTGPEPILLSNMQVRVLSSPPDAA